MAMKYVQVHLLTYPSSKQSYIYHPDVLSLLPPSEVIITACNHKTFQDKERQATTI